MDETKAPEPVIWETREIGITGMTCNNCVRKVEQALRSAPGVRDVRVNRDTACASVTFDRRMTDLPALHDTLLRTGYRPVETPS